MSKGVKIKIETLYLQAFYLNVGKYIEIINYYLSQKNKTFPLGDYIKIFGGFAFKSTEYQKEGIPVIRISDFQNEQIVLEYCKRYKEDSNLEKYELKNGDIIIALTGGTIGKLAIVQEGLGKIYLNQRVGRFDILNPDLFEKEYAYWIARGVQEKVKNLAWGGAQPNVSGKQIENMEFPIPDKAVQRKVIRFLNDLKNNSLEGKVYFDLDCEKKIIRLQNKQIALFQIKENTSNEKELLKLLRQQILQDVISGKLTADWRAENPNIEPAIKLLEKIKAEKEKLIVEKKINKEKPLPKITANETPFDLPEKWEWCRLGEMINFQNGYSFKSFDFRGRDFGVIRIGDMQEGEIVEQSMKFIDKKIAENISDNFIAKTGDILIAMSGATTGKIAINKSTKKYYINQRVGKINILLNETLKSFLIHILVYNRTEFLTNSNGSIIDNLRTEQIKSFIIPLPPLSEQKAIVAKLEKLMEQVAKLEEKIKQNKQDAEMLMQSFLVEAFKN